MKDYEILHIPNGKMPNIGMLRLTVSENRVGLYMPVLDALDRPSGIIIHRGINGNEGKLIIEAAEFDPDDPRSGVIPLDYERKKIDFYSKDFVDTCKDMIRKYGGGEFSRGVFFTVKGVRESDTMVLFDFRIVASRVVTSAQKPKKRSASGKSVSRRGSANTSSRVGRAQTEQGEKAKTFSPAVGQTQPLGRFSMPAMGRSY